MKSHLDRIKETQRAAWFFLHNAARGWDANGIQETLDNSIPVTEFIKHLCVAMQCQCAKHCNDYINSNPRQRGENWQQYLIRFHNAVNERKGAPILSDEEASGSLDARNQLFAAQTAAVTEARGFPQYESAAASSVPAGPSPASAEASSSSWKLVLGVIVLVAVLGTAVVFYRRHMQTAAADARLV